MRVKMILPALTEAKSVYWRAIKYSLFPPLGLAALAGYLSKDDEVVIEDEHIEELNLEDTPDVVVIQVYVTSAYRAYSLADHYRKKGVYVCLGGLHVTALPREALSRADSIFLGPGEASWPKFLEDFRAGRPQRVYLSKERSLEGMPEIRRDLIKSGLYLIPNSIVVSRGCPHSCDFCYKEGFFKGGKFFYTQTVDAALREINRLPGRHLFFLDDNLFGNEQFALGLFNGMKGMKRIWQAAGTVQAVLNSSILEKAAQSGMRSLFIGFETLHPGNLREHRKYSNVNRDYSEAIKRLHALGVMVNGSFVFGMDNDDKEVFNRTVDWALSMGIETATFHILTPYPGTRLYERVKKQNRLLHTDWDKYDTRHCVFLPLKMKVEELEQGYWRAYKNFYRWRSICRAAFTKDSLLEKIRHLAYAGGWKKMEPVWSWAIRWKQVKRMLPLLETVLSGG